MTELPTGKGARATKAVGALAPASLKLLTSMATTLLQSPEQTRELLQRRHEELADGVVDMLGELRGGAMKIGQLASFVDVELIPTEHRETYQRKLARLRDAAPPMEWPKVRRVLEREWETPVESLFEDFEHDAAAAASIGQVHRAVLADGRKVAVKVQYPEVARALRADVDTAASVATVLTPLGKAMMPGLEPRVVADELRERLLEELDFELEAQNQRAFARAYRGHPFILVPPVVSELCRERVLVSEWVDGVGFDEMRALPDAQRDRIGAIVHRFYLGAIDWVGRFNTDPHPGNYLLRRDGSIAFLDFGNVKLVDPGWLQMSKRLLAAVIAGDAEGVARELDALGYVHRVDSLDRKAMLAQARAGSDWFACDRKLTIDRDYVARTIAALTSADSARTSFAIARHLKIPREEIWIRRVQVGVLAVLGQLRATGNWHRTASEFIFGDAPQTDLGRAEHAFFAGRGITVQQAASR